MEHAYRIVVSLPLYRYWADHWWVTCVARDKDGNTVDSVLIDHWRNGVMVGDSPFGNRARWPYESMPTNPYAPGISEYWPHKDASGKSPPIPASDLDGIPTQDELNYSELPKKYY